MWAARGWSFTAVGLAEVVTRDGTERVWGMVPPFRTTTSPASLSASSSLSTESVLDPAAAAKARLDGWMDGWDATALRHELAPLTHAEQWAGSGGGGGRGGQWAHLREVGARGRLFPVAAPRM